MGQLDKSIQKRGKASWRSAAQASAFCSFCFKFPQAVNVLIAGPGGIFICDACVEVCRQLAANRTQTFPADPPIEQLNTDWLLALLPPLAAALRGKSGQMQRLVDILRSRRISWARIGRSLGITRQSAWERFANPAPGTRHWRALPVHDRGGAKLSRHR